MDCALLIGRDPGDGRSHPDVKEAADHTAVPGDGGGYLNGQDPDGERHGGE